MVSDGFPIIFPHIGRGQRDPTRAEIERANVLDRVMRRGAPRCERGRVSPGPARSLGEEIRSEQLPGLTHLQRQEHMELAETRDRQARDNGQNLYNDAEYSSMAMGRMMELGGGFW